MEGIERFANHLQVMIASKLVMIDLNVDYLKVVDELENLEEFTDGENFALTGFKPVKSNNQIALCRLENLILNKQGNRTRIFQMYS